MQCTRYQLRFQQSVTLNRCIVMQSLWYSYTLSLVSHQWHGKCVISVHQRAALVYSDPKCLYCNRREVIHVCHGQLHVFFFFGVATISAALLAVTAIDGRYVAARQSISGVCSSHNPDDVSFCYPGNKISPSVCTVSARGAKSHSSSNAQQAMSLSSIKIYSCDWQNNW